MTAIPQKEECVCVCMGGSNSAVTVVLIYQVTDRSTVKIMFALSINRKLTSRNISKLQGQRVNTGISLFTVFLIYLM